MAWCVQACVRLGLGRAVAQGVTNKKADVARRQLLKIIKVPTALCPRDAYTMRLSFSISGMWLRILAEFYVCDGAMAGCGCGAAAVAGDVGPGQQHAHLRLDLRDGHQVRPAHPHPSFDQHDWHATAPSRF